MSSPKAAGKARAHKPARAASRAAKPAPRTAAPETDAVRLAAEIEQGLGRGDLIAPDALQALMAALCKSYAAHVEAGHDFMPLKSRASVSSTDIMTTASGLLKSQSLAVFELGMWQSWTGR